MRNKLFFSTLCAMISLTAFSQSLQYKAVEFVCTKYQNKPMEPPESKECHFQITFDMDSSILRVFSPNTQVFKLSPKPLSYSETDSITLVKFDAIDTKMISCTVLAAIYNPDKYSHAASFLIEYPDKIYRYYVDE